MSRKPHPELEPAWQWREQRGVLRELEAVRIFHGPGEGSGYFARVSIDRFGRDYWVTHWGEERGARDSDAPRAREALADFLAEKGARSAVLLERPARGLPAEPRTLLGEPPSGRFEASEGDARYLVQLQGVRHPGLFLDHYPLRLWLRARMAGLSVLNCFSYTGSLSVAAALGGASSVTTLDLSKSTVAWATENWNRNGLEPGRARWIGGDYFDWLPRLRKEGSRYGCVILDPPSFSRGKKGSFSTAKDLGRLHELAFSVLEPGGFLVTSINSGNVSPERFESEVLSAARAGRLRPRVVGQIGLPETFPTRLDRPADRYLKGWILQAE